LAGFGLRLFLLDGFPLREDEAIYGYWALHALHQDPLFLQVWPDKPPLFLWLLAGLFWLTGPDAAAARWLNIAAATLTIPLVAVGARRLWGSSQAGLAAGLVLALNPYALSFAPTVYTDPLLVLFGTLAVAFALPGAHRVRAGWAGVWLGAAIMTKQQGLLYAPLVVSLLFILPARAGRRQLLARCLAGVALVVLPIMLWDSLRWAVAPSPWDQSVRTYAPLALAPLATWASRLLEWAALGWYLVASNILWLMAGLALSAALLMHSWWRPVSRQPSAAALLIFGWGAAYLALHVVTTVQVWDRYLLPLAPLWAWALAWPVSRLRSPGRHQARPRVTNPGLQDEPYRSPRFATVGSALLLAGALVLLPPALAAARGELPVGGDHGDYAGLPVALAWVAAQPRPQVLYHRREGWHARFYLYDQVRAGTTELRWFPSATYLADNAAKTPYPRRFLIVPDWAPLPDLPLYLATRGLALQTQLRSGRFTVQEIVHRPQAACDWCWCGPSLALDLGPPDGRPLLDRSRMTLR
jgi:4-amino-4-deoxy-L-arabinose transferase-like glycosyltransferase